jgi:hypothetical protein
VNPPSEWQEPVTFVRLLDLLGDRLTLRKARLFTAGYCRLRPERVASALAARLLDLVEAVADEAQPESLLDEVERRLAKGGSRCALVREAVVRMPNPIAQCPSTVWLRRSILSINGTAAVAHASRHAGPAPADAHPAHPWHQKFLSAYIEYVKLKADLLRCLFPDPSRPVDFSPAWRTGTAVTLARTMYAARDFSAMPILADALQDAGCDGDDILAHCRDTTRPHVRGCWVVDRVLEK